ncbi:hypothetical protein ACH5RR_002900 [Cinchona calisaya]|uniref:Protein FAR1-RELATED SEQUENCE n=1 Tax=Cinchona calisaya TaxID=153742 RepID=A0ABD3ATV5_9GENT
MGVSFCYESLICDGGTDFEGDNLYSDSDGVVDFDEDNFSSNSEGIVEDVDLNDEVIDDFKEMHLNDKLGIMKMRFAKEEEAYEFYNFYAKSIGFSVRYENVGFALRNLYSKMDAVMKREIAMGDIERAIDYLAAKKYTYSMFFYKYCTDEQGCLRSLIWADSQSTIDFNSKMVKQNKRTCPYKGKEGKSGEVDGQATMEDSDFVGEEDEKVHFNKG